MSGNDSYFDELDGDQLACRPNNIEEGYEIVCSYGIPFIGYCLVLAGFRFTHLTHIYRRQRILVAKTTRAGNGGLSAVSEIGNKTTCKSADKPSTAMFTHLEKLLLSQTILTFSAAGGWILNGFGTMYSTAHIRGSVGDIFASIFFASMWYTALLQHRGAIYFKSLAPPLRPKQNYKPSMLYSAVSMLLNATQSWLAPVISTSLWTLLRANIYTRGWFMFYLAFLTLIFGMRSFLSIVLQRLSTLRRVAGMVGAARGTREEEQRRKGFLTSKTMSILIDMLAVFTTYIILPGSLVVSQSSFSSQKFIINMVVVMLPTLAMTLVTTSHLHSNYNKVQRKLGAASNWKTMQQAQHKSGFVGTEGMSSVSGMSVVQHSDV